MCSLLRNHSELQTRCRAITTYNSVFSFPAKKFAELHPKKDDKKEKKKGPKEEKQKKEVKKEVKEEEEEPKPVKEKDPYAGLPPRYFLRNYLQRIAAVNWTN